MDDKKSTLSQNKERILLESKKENLLKEIGLLQAKYPNYDLSTLQSVISIIDDLSLIKDRLKHIEMINKHLHRLDNSEL